MGTNYYLEGEQCGHCGRSDEDKHIGKSSMGWCFSLHVIPDDGLNTLEDWISLFEIAPIKNEYGEKVSADEMIDIINNRSGKEKKWDTSPHGYADWEEFHSMNHSERGPKGLLRHTIGGHCIGHGEGTYDYISGEFF